MKTLFLLCVNIDFIKILKKIKGMKNIQSVPYNEPIDLRSFDIFKGLTDEEIETVNQSINCTLHKRGNTIYHEGSRINGTYLVVEGILKYF